MLMVSLACIVGCASTSKPQTPTPNNAGEGIAGADALAHSAQTTVDVLASLASGNLDPVIRILRAELLDLREKLSLAGVSEQLAQANAASLYHDVIVAREQTKSATQHGEDRLKAEQDHFWSYQQRIWWKVIVGVAVAAGAVLLLAGDFIPAGTLRGLLAAAWSGFTGLFKRGPEATGA